MNQHDEPALASIVEQITAWLEAHDKLAGWAQAVGSILALVVALVAVQMQARYSARQDDRRTAERVRSLARTLQYWRDLCVNSYEVRRLEWKDQDVALLNATLVEFNHTATEINKFAFVDAPSELVFRALSKYRGMCGPLSSFMTPSYNTALSPVELKEFNRIIDELSEITRGLMADAERIAG